MDKLETTLVLVSFIYYYCCSLTKLHCRNCIDLTNELEHFDSDSDDVFIVNDFDDGEDFDDDFEKENQGICFDSH